VIDILSIPEVADVNVVYAIGDIHGRLDLLRQIEDAVQADISSRPGTRPLICYLGDYVDRGPDSAGVIAHLVTKRFHGIPCIYLKGNHEDRMLAFLKEPKENGPSWMKFGGREALESYGLCPSQLGDEDWHRIRDLLKEALPTDHLEFLSQLQLAVRWRNHLFVHAGLDPDRGLDAQDPHDLMWIREPFITSTKKWGLRVVHGHVIETEPVLRFNRIGVDTGAYRSGVLTSAVISFGDVRFLQTKW
jgi:serine/threonine protein phosphatase 1